MATIEQYSEVILRFRERARELGMLLAEGKTGNETAIARMKYQAAKHAMDTFFMRKGKDEQKLQHR